MFFHTVGKGFIFGMYYREQQKKEFPLDSCIRYLSTENEDEAPFDLICAH